MALSLNSISSIIGMSNSNKWVGSTNKWVGSTDTIGISSTTVVPARTLQAMYDEAFLQEEAFRQQANSPSLWGTPAKADTVQSELLQYMLDNGVPMYDDKQVGAFMQSLCDEQNKHRDARLGRIYWQYVPLNAYKHAIPQHILERAAKLKRHFKDRVVSFSVTDYKVSNPDPFIAVSLDHCPAVIFGAWDEPGFGLAKKDAELKA